MPHSQVYANEFYALPLVSGRPGSIVRQPSRYLRNGAPEQNKHLGNWLQRELQALLLEEVRVREEGVQACRGSYRALHEHALDDVC